MEDGIINLDSDRGKSIGFTSDKFMGYLWKTGEHIIITVINSLEPNKGHLKALFTTIEAQGYKIKVPTPFANMTEILIRMGFQGSIEQDNRFGPVEVWMKDESDGR